MEEQQPSFEKSAKVNVPFEIIKDTISLVEASLKHWGYDTITTIDEKRLVSKFEIDEIQYDDKGVPNRLIMKRKS